MVWLAGPFFEASGIEHLAVLGGLLFVGMGALVLGASPIIECNSDLVRYEVDIDFWIGVSEEWRINCSYLGAHQYFFSHPTMAEYSGWL